MRIILLGIYIVLVNGCSESAREIIQSTNVPTNRIAARLLINDWGVDSLITINIILEDTKKKGEDPRPDIELTNGEHIEIVYGNNTKIIDHPSNFTFSHKFDFEEPSNSDIEYQIFFNREDGSSVEIANVTLSAEFTITSPRQYDVLFYSDPVEIEWIEGNRSKNIDLNTVLSCEGYSFSARETLEDTGEYSADFHSPFWNWNSDHLDEITDSDECQLSIDLERRYTHDPNPIFAEGEITVIRLRTVDGITILIDSE